MDILKPRIIFMGTPEFAVPSLGALIMNNYNIVAVVSSPDKPSGRGRKLRQSAITSYAKDNYLPLFQPTNLKDHGFIEELSKLKPDIAVVVAFRMLPREIWSLPKLGTFNLHASLLPQYRGAAPINRAIMNGERVSGLTTFLIDEQIDTGNILYRKEILIGCNETAGELHDRMMRKGAGLVVKTVVALASGNARPLRQEKFSDPGKKLHTAPKIFSQDCYIDWDDDAQNIHNHIRGLSPYPGARTLLRLGDRKIMVKIHEARYRISNHKLETGHILTDKDSIMSVSCNDGLIDIIKIQPEGKRVMSIEEYARGTDLQSLEIIKGLQV